MLLQLLRLGWWLVMMDDFVLSYGAVLHLIVVLLVLFNWSFMIKYFNIGLFYTAIISILRDGSPVAWLV